MYRADDNTDEIRKLNRSIFIPAVTFNKEKKRLAQEKRREMRFLEEQDERQLAMQDIRETQNRLGRTATYGTRGGSGEDDEEGIGRRQLTSGEMRLRAEERKRYQMEPDEDDDALEDRIDDGLDAVTKIAKNLTAIGLGMSSELDAHNQRLERISGKTDKLDMRVRLGTEKVWILLPPCNIQC